MAAALLAGRPAAAIGAPSTGGSENVDVALVAEHASIRPGEPFEVGLRMKLEDGWHTYWKNPGDSGLPLRIEWSLPPGFTAGPIEWPAPQRIPTSSLMTYGFEHEVLLVVTITPPATIAAKTVTIAGSFDWLECADVCVAGSASLALTMPVRADVAAPGPAASLFAAARARRPRPSAGWTFAATAGPRAIELGFTPPPGIEPRGAYFFVDQPLVVEHAAPQGFERVGTGYRLTMKPAENAASPATRITGVLMLDGVSLEAGNAIAVDVEAAAGDPAPAAVGDTTAAPAAAASPPAPAKPNSGSTALITILVAVAVLALAVILRRRSSRR
ncbi:MAG TPA: protein-disulfide reductase DsbD domain-containing protein [Candidatus Eisenbacteria bacterium]|nr:protein-disulfide reductase DsbD domain-containing protein [Candidatus Eisenbacteria bacterium]